ncbi:MAG: hypothetical protein GYB32_02985 [Algicola sp.]|nr:hypothetical protein [Algicola sp.]
MERLLFLFLLLGSQAIAQSEHISNLSQNLVGYYDTASTTPLRVFNGINGHVVASLGPTTDKKNWLKITIVESKNDWFRIEQIESMPDGIQNNDVRNGWIPKSGVMLNIDSSDADKTIYIYDEASLNSNRIHKMDRCQPVYLLDINGTWAKIVFQVGRKKVEGWLNYQNQVAYPWSTCEITN